MSGRQIRRVPALILIALLAVLTLRAWLDVGDEPLTYSNKADGLVSTTWAASVSTQGRLAVDVRYEFSNDDEHTLNIRTPEGSRYLSVNGMPISASVWSDATVTAGSSTTVSYELPGRVTRYRDGALLRLVRINDTSIDGDEGLFPCPRCYIDGIGYGNSPVYGALAVPGADAVRFEFLGLSSVRSSTDSGPEGSDRDVVRFVGINSGTEDVAMVAVLPSEAVPDLAIGDGTVAQALADVKSEMKPSGEHFHSPHRPVHGERSAALILTILLGAIVAWIAARLIWSAGSRAARRAAAPLTEVPHFADVRSVRPTNLEPALAGAVVGDAVKGDRSVVAATIVELARRNVVEFTGNDSRRFTLIVPAGATGATPFEQAVIDSLRLGDDPPVRIERTSPHLWGEHADEATKVLRRALINAALREKLLRVNIPALLLVPLTIAMGVIAITGTTGGVKFAWFVTIVGPLLALATVGPSTLVLTAAGRAEQAHWVEYATWLHTNEHLAQAEPWAVANYGPVLAYAAALGAAPEVVRCLSPDRRQKT